MESKLMSKYTTKYTCILEAQVYIKNGKVEGIGIKYYIATHTDTMIQF